MDVVLIAKADLQTDLLAALIRRSTHHKVFLLADLNLPPRLSLGDVLYIFDLEHIDRHTCSNWLTDTQKHSTIKAVFINVEDDDRASALVALPNVYGLFLQSADGKQLANGLRAILRDEYSFPQRVLCHHLEKTRAIQQLLDKTEDVHLSTKQRQLLMLLLHGDSNQNIANKLAISIPTVKTHFYRLYKKLGVRNRTQAATWAKDHRHALVEHQGSGIAP